LIEPVKPIKNLDFRHFVVLEGFSAESDPGSGRFRDEISFMNSGSRFAGCFGFQGWFFELEKDLSGRVERRSTGKRQTILSGCDWASF